MRKIWKKSDFLYARKTHLKDIMETKLHLQKYKEGGWESYNNDPKKIGKGSL